MFRALIDPINEQSFFDCFWEQKEFFCRSANPNRFEELLSIENLDLYLARNDLRYPCLRLAKDGKELALASYSKHFKFGDYAAAGLIQPDRLLECYRDGATIIIQMAHQSFPSLSKLSVDLESHLQYLVQMTVYLTPPHGQGFTAHYDTHNVVVVQLSGSKSWQVFDFEKRAPLLTDTFEQETFVPHKKPRNYELTPGCVLYVPRGMVHQAAANSEPSLHVTIGLFPPLWIDLFHDHLRKMEMHEAFRRSPFWAGFKGKDEVAHELKRLLETFVDEFDPALLADEAVNKSITGQIQNNENRLLDILKISNAGLNTRFRPREHVRWRSFLRHEHYVIRCFDKELLFKKTVGATVDRILSSEAEFSIQELDVPMDETSKLKLCIKLTKEGLLTIH